MLEGRAIGARLGQVGEGGVQGGPLVLEVLHNIPIVEIMPDRPGLQKRALHKLHAAQQVLTL